MTKTTKNRTTATLATGSTIEANNVPKLFQCIKVVKNFVKKPIEQTNTRVPDFKNIQDVEKQMKINNKMNSVIVDSKNNCRAFISVSV